MSDGRKLVAAVLDAGSVETLRLAGEELFEDEELDLFRFVKQHYRRYAELPDAGTVESELRIRLPRAPEPVAYYMQRVYDRKLYVELREEFSSMRDALSSMDLERARQSVDRMKMACRVATPDNDVRDVAQAADVVMQMYQQAHANPGVSGIPLGWDRLDAMLGGYQRGDLVTWVARLGMGKTYIMLRQAIHAWRMGYNVLIVTMEMTIYQIVRRVLGMEAGVNPDYIRKGMVDAYGMRRLTRYIDTIAHANRFNIYAGSFSKKVSDVEVLMHELAPDIVFIDGAYLMHPDTTVRSVSRMDRVPEVFDQLKKLTITSDRPIVATSQFSRQAGKRGKEGSLETISFTDAIAMHSSLVFSIKSGPPPYETSRRFLEIMKGREGEEGSYQINYQFNPMNFSEVFTEQLTAEGVDIEWMSQAQ